MKWLWYFLLILLPLAARSQYVIITPTKTKICVGDTVALTASPYGVVAPHYKWSINGLMTGADSVIFVSTMFHNNDTVRCTITNAAGASVCTSGPVIIHVDTFLHAGTITGPDKVCEGTTVTMTDTVVGGNWSVSSERLQVDSMGIVKGKFGSYYSGCDSLYPDKVFYTMSNLCNSDTAYKIITVHPQPDATFFVQEIDWGPAGLCAGDWWYPLGSYCCDSIHSTYGRIEVSGNSIRMGAPGSDYLYCTTTNYCGTSSYGTWMYFGGPPGKVSILGDFKDLCIGMSDSLRSTTSGYSWESLNHKVTLSSNYYSGTERVTAIDTGMDVISVEVKNECGSSWGSYSIKVKPSPDSIKMSPKVCKGTSAVLIDSTANGTWASSAANVVIDGSIATYADTGRARITYTLSSGCATSASLIVDDCIAVVELFPNPTRDELIIHLTEGGYSDCAIMNSIGQLVASTNIIHEYTSINTSLLASGIYYIKLVGSNGTHIAKMLKE